MGVWGPTHTHTHRPMGVGHSHGCMGHNLQWVNLHCTHECSNRIHWLMSNTYAELSRQVLIGDQAVKSIILNFYSFILDNYILDVFVFHKPMKAPTCQIQVFSGSKSGRILDQGDKDGRAEVGLGQEWLWEYGRPIGYNDRGQALTPCIGSSWTTPQPLQLVSAIGHVQ